VVIRGSLPEKLQKDAEMYAGCVSGAVGVEEYLEIIRNNGFADINIHKQKEIQLPDELLSETLDHTESQELRNGTVGIYSITVSGYKK